MTELSNFEEESMESILDVGDVITATMKIDYQVKDYEAELSMSYKLSDKISYMYYNHPIAADYDYDIKDFIEEDLNDDTCEIDDYEIFDVDNSNKEYQTEKIRVKSLK